MNIKTTLKTSVAAAALFAVAVPVAEAGNVTNGNGNSLTISGQVSKSVMYMDNGDGTRVTVADDDESGTRFRMVGKGKINEAWTVGTNIEMEMQSNGTNNVNTQNEAGLAGDVGTGQTNTTHRVAYINFANKQMGSLSVGRVYGSADGVMYADLSGTFMAIDSGLGFHGLGISLHQSGVANGTSTGQTVGTFFTSQDGGRQEGVRYDAPAMGGLKLSATLGAGGRTEWFAGYGAKFSGVQIDLKGAYFGAQTDVSTHENGWHVSGAAKHDSGLNIFGGYGEAEIAGVGRKNATTANGGIGYSANLTSAGATNFAVAMARHQNGAANNDEMDTITIGVQQAVTDAGMLLFASGTQYDASRTGTTYDDVVIAKVGARVQF